MKGPVAVVLAASALHLLLVRPTRAQVPVPGLRSAIVAGITADRVHMAFDDAEASDRNGVGVTLGGRLCLTCRWSATPIDGALTLVGGLTATGVAGITPHNEPYGFSQLTGGIQLSLGTRRFPGIKPYVTLQMTNQFTAERLAARLGRSDPRPDTLFNYQGAPPSHAIGVELGTVRGGALDVRLTRVSGIFRNAEYRKITSFNPALRYDGWMVGVGYVAPFSGYWSVARSPRSFTLVDENDAFGGSSDSAYTQGIRLVWDVGRWPAESRVGRAVQDLFPYVSGSILVPDARGVTPVGGCAEGAPRPCGTLRFAIGQTMYTPPVLTDTARNVQTRPYAGYLFVSAAATEMFRRYVVSSELQLGLVGPGAGARNTQSLAHWTNSWMSPRPLGWSNQLRPRLQMSLRNSYETKLLEYCVNVCDGSRNELRLFDLNTDAEMLLGTPMTRASAGASARVGFGFPDFQGQHRIPETRLLDRGDLARRVVDGAVRVAQHFWIAGFFNVAERYVAHNGLLTGTGADTGPDGWSTVRQIEREPHVDEYAGGVAVGIGQVVASFQRVTRSSEFKPNGGIHRFGSLSVTIHTRN